MGEKKPGGAEHSLMDWEELAGSCTTPRGNIRQRLEAHEREREGRGREGALGYYAALIKDLVRRRNGDIKAGNVCFCERVRKREKECLGV